PRGEIHGIVGRSGAGKSTLIRCLTALEKPTSGSIIVDGTDLSSLREKALRKARRKLGMVFQHVNLLDSRTTAGNISHPLEIAGVSKPARQMRVAELLDLVGLTGRDRNYPAQLSGGQKQRVGIARALATHPEVLLCDEPTSALDSRTTRQILDLIRDLRDQLGITVVIITHEMSVVREVCDAVTLLADGRIAQTGPLTEVVAEPDSQLAHELVPLPTAVPGVEGRLVNVVRRGKEAITSGFFGELEQIGVRPEVTSGTVESIGGVRISRFQIALHAIPSGPLDEGRYRAAVQAMRGNGYGVEEVR
ncbi:MAG: ATP-binding cassette domain-containing protein, partial [Propionibacterium sp.]|nr:ATP-binding cassette domain-containing protein [Propionibacterium sp.]